MAHRPKRGHPPGLPPAPGVAPLILGLPALVASYLRTSCLRTSCRLASCLVASWLVASWLLLGPAPPASAATPPLWSWPLDGRVSVIRGFEPPTEPWMAGHRGVDLRASPGEAVRAAGAGTVTFAGRVGGTPAVAVSHPDGSRTTYEPVLPVVARGDVVARGAIVGRVSVGGSHCLPTACLHWGLRRGEIYLDPLTLVDADAAVRLLPVWSDSASPVPLGGAAQPSGRLPPASPISSLRAPAETGSIVGSSPPGWPAVRLGALNRVRAFVWQRW